MARFDPGYVAGPINFDAVFLIKPHVNEFVCQFQMIHTAANSTVLYAERSVAEDQK